MLATYIVSTVIILTALGAWVAVQQAARRFAARHPEFGAAREEGAGCGFLCRCTGGEPCPWGRDEEHGRKRDRVGGASARAEPGPGRGQ
jgi:hypothetical protein